MADLERIFNKIDKMDERLNNIDTSLVRQTVSLEEHVKRTNLLEDEIKPIKKHIYFVNAVFRIIGLLSTISGIIVAAYEIWK